MRTLAAVPAHNEQTHIADVVRRIKALGIDCLVVDDGSRDATPEILRSIPEVHVLQHDENLGYGKALIDAFGFGIDRGYDVVVTVDADNQHEPEMIPGFVALLKGADIVSGTRFPEGWDAAEGLAPGDRIEINRRITRIIRGHTDYELTDSFCGFKAYRTRALGRLDLGEHGYGMCLELWIKAARAGLTVCEAPVRLIYNDPSRTFGEVLDKSDERYRYYLRVIRRALAETAGRVCADCGAPPSHGVGACHDGGRS